MIFLQGGNFMEYTIQKLARLSGVTTRTLRYYDEINILKPARINSSGYRIYGQDQVDRLQQILFYRELDVSLEEIGKILSAPDFTVKDALRSHREKLLAKRARLDALIANVEKTLVYAKGETDMGDQEKFEGFKQRLVAENERKYGTEIREKYGEEAIDGSNRKLKNMTQEDYGRVTALDEEIMQTLLSAYRTGDPAGELAQRAAYLHRQWLTFYWDSYSREAHAGIAQMYVDDPRFTAYYDKHQPGLAAFLRDAVLIYTGTKSK